MPVDKFGRHFLRTSAYGFTLKNKSICFFTSTIPCYICQYSQLHIICITKFSGQKVRLKRNPLMKFIYLLDNYIDVDSMHVTGTVESLSIRH